MQQYTCIHGVLCYVAYRRKKSLTQKALCECERVGDDAQVLAIRTFLSPGKPELRLDHVNSTWLNPVLLMCLDPMTLGS